jgi:NitT/TauT family transport system permease protein
MGGLARCFIAGRRSGRIGRIGRALGGTTDGGAAMTAQAQQAGFTSAALGMLAVCVFRLSSPPAIGLIERPTLLAAIIAIAILFGGAAVAAPSLSLAAGLAGVLLACIATLALLGDAAIAGQAALGFWLMVLACWLAAGICITMLAAIGPRSKAVGRALDIAIALLFGLFVVYLWEVVVRGFGVPSVLLPAPSVIAARFFGSLRMLWQDFFQTFILGVLSGYIIGCGAGFLVAIIANRFTFLGRGLLPIGNFVSALPIVGIAPIMVMWFGFDWPSKAAVVAIIVFFPMLVNSLAGLNAAGYIERDLMRSYGAGYLQTMTKLYLPVAMPFIFNALKINSTLALIGAIVAEFFGTPTVGIGFRISIEAGRMALDMVWAEIVLAALAGMAFYGTVALAERVTTFWHPSYRT